MIINLLQVTMTTKITDLLSNLEALSERSTELTTAFPIIISMLFSYSKHSKELSRKYSSKAPQIIFS